jgi:hypothetical protein
MRLQIVRLSDTAVRVGGNGVAPLTADHTRCRDQPGLLQPGACAAEVLLLRGRD